MKEKRLLKFTAEKEFVTKKMVICAPGAAGVKMIHGKKIVNFKRRSYDKNKYL